MREYISLVKPIISIVVPVFNVEKYLSRCLDSIFNQEFEYPFEVVAVDDCSTDTSLKILYEYKSRFNNLIIIEHNENKKLSIVRRSGISAATGSYIMHVDSDDCILPNTLNVLYNKCIQINADIGVYNYFLTHDRGNHRSNIVKEDKLITQKYEVEDFFFGSVWNKIVKREYLEDMICNQYPTNNLEDFLYSTEVFLKVDSILLISDYCYIYFLNNNSSISHKINPHNYFINQLSILSQLELIFKKYKPIDRYVEKVTNYSVMSLLKEILRFHFINEFKSSEKTEHFITNISESVLINKSTLSIIEKSFKSKIYCFIMCVKFYNLRTVLSIVLKK